MPSTSRRTVLRGLAAATVAGVVGPAFIPAAQAARPLINPGRLEAELASLDKPIYLLETAVPETFSTQKGSTLSISGAHGKVGTHSLRWDHRADAVLTVRTPLRHRSDPTPGQVDYFAVWIYNEDPVDGHLRFRFGRAGHVDAWFDFHLDFTGWRTAWVRYAEDMEGTPRRDMDRITIVAPPSAGTLWFDQLVTNVPLRPDRPTPDFQVPTLAPGLRENNNYHWLGLLDFWKQRPEFDTTEVTAAEITDAEKIHERLVTRQRSNVPFDSRALADLEERFASFGVPQLADPDAHGTDLRPATPGAFVFHDQFEIIPAQYRSAVEEFADARALRKLWEKCGLPAAQTWDCAHRAGDGQAAARAGQLVLRLMAHMHDQGWAAGSSQGTVHHIGYAYRSWADSLLMLEPLLRERGLWEQAGTSIEWYAGSGRLVNDTRRHRRTGLPAQRRGPLAAHSPDAHPGPGHQRRAQPEIGRAHV